MDAVVPLASVVAGVVQVTLQQQVLRVLQT
jgi:hypothetical protein